MATIIGFVSEKGGVGKTTSVYHIGVALSRFHDKRVLVLDTDYQRGGLTCRLIPEMLENFRLGEIDDVTLYNAYRALYSDMQELPSLTIRTTTVGVDLVPSDPRLNTVSVDKMPPPRNLRDGNRLLVKHLMRIYDSLQPLAEDYDYVLIDSHPDLHDLEKAVIAASDFIVSPVKLDQQSAVGVPSTVEITNDVNQDIQAALALAQGGEYTYDPTKFIGAVGMMCREYGEALKYTEQAVFNRLRRTTGVFDAYVTEGDGLRQAAQLGCPVYDVAGDNADKQSGYFRNVTKELLEHVA